jgi:hypothetical protein
VLRQWLLLLTLFLPALGALSAGPTRHHDPAFEIYETSHEPNYELTRDRADLSQLTDGKTVPFPPWSSRGSVGWVDRSPLVLFGRLREPDARNGRPMEFSFISAKGRYAGVEPPLRIDAYCGTSATGWIHVGFATPAPEEFPDRSSASLTVPIRQPCQANFAFVAHGNGPFIMLDEIVYRVGESRLLAPPIVAAPVSDASLVSDSGSRLRAARSIAANDVVGAKLSRAVVGTLAWLAPPWGPLSLEQFQVSETSRQSIELVAPARWPVFYVIGVWNAGRADSTFKLQFSAAAAADFKAFRVLPVVAANGETVFDALQPLDGWEISVPARSIAYVLVQESMGRAPSEYRVDVSEGVRNHSLRIRRLPLASMPGNSQLRPAVSTWAYRSDGPIWAGSTERATVDLLRQAGVNVFVVHPESIPSAGSTEDWQRKLTRLRSDLRLYRGAGKVLLFTAWDERLSPAVSREQLATAVTSWAKLIAGVMREEGYDFENWAVYPIDEPRSSDYERLRTVAEALRAVDSRIQIYANPGEIGPTDLLPQSALSRMLDSVDIWQPMTGQAAKRLRLLLGNDRRADFWIYRVGQSPAKAHRPSCYRKLAWDAHEIGATGVGFWSFSDTGGSSAWNDFDGTRPDWAVVYEMSDGGIASSRRWEAFKQGVQELGAMINCSAGSASSPEAACLQLRRLLESELGNLDCD